MSNKNKTPQEILAATAYDRFIREGLAAGFLDDQIDFLERWLAPKQLPHD